MGRHTKKQSMLENRKTRVRRKVKGTTERPRMTVFRSDNHLYVQVIDDVKGATLVTASTLDKDLRPAIVQLREAWKAEAAAKQAKIDAAKPVVEVAAKLETDEAEAAKKVKKKGKDGAPKEGGGGKDDAPKEAKAKKGKAAPVEKPKKVKSGLLQDSVNTRIGKLVGEALAKRCLEKNIALVSFDRNGYRYHGRIRAVADGARKGGLKF